MIGETDWSRRQRGVTRRGLVTGALGLALTAGVSAASRAAPVTFEQTGAAASDAPAEAAGRTIGLRSLNTGERLDVTYWRNGGYDQASLDLLDTLMRDWRNDAVTGIDPALYDTVWQLGRLVGQDPEFTVICGYRSRATNRAMVANGRRGVAGNSLHVLGKAADIALPGCPIDRLHEAALALDAGGVGYYPRSGFVHIDTGEVRNWTS